MTTTERRDPVISWRLVIALTLGPTLALLIGAVLVFGVLCLADVVAGGMP